MLCDCQDISFSLQLTVVSHMYGARNMGNSGVEIDAATKLVSHIAEVLQKDFDTREMDFVERVKAW